MDPACSVQYDMHVCYFIKAAWLYCTVDVFNKIEIIHSNVFLGIPQVFNWPFLACTSFWEDVVWSVTTGCSICWWVPGKIRIILISVNPGYTKSLMCLIITSNLYSWSFISGQQKRELCRNYQRHLVVCYAGFKPQGKDKLRLSFFT